MCAVKPSQTQMRGIKGRTLHSEHADTGIHVFAMASPHQPVQMHRCTPLAAIGAAFAAVGCDVLTSHTAVAREDAAGMLTLTCVVLAVVCASPSAYDTVLIRWLQSSTQSPACVDSVWNTRPDCVQLIGRAQRRQQWYQTVKRKLNELLHPHPAQGQQNEVFAPLVQEPALLRTHGAVIREHGFAGFATSSAQRSLQLLLLAIATYMAPHDASAPSRASLSAFVLVAMLIALMSAFWPRAASGSKATANCVHLAQDMTVRLAVCVTLYCSLRQFRHALMHCSEALARQCMPFYDSESCADACISCDVSMAVASAFASTLAAGMCKAVLLAPIGLPPSACIPLYHGAAVQLVTALILLLRYATAIKQFDVLFGEDQEGLLGKGRDADEMRRFMQTNSSAGLCLCVGGALFVSAAVAQVPTQQWLQECSNQTAQAPKASHFDGAARVGKCAAAGASQTWHIGGVTCVAAVAAVAAMAAHVAPNAWGDYHSWCFVLSLSLLGLYGGAQVVHGASRWYGLTRLQKAARAMRLVAAVACMACLTVDFVLSIEERTPFTSTANGVLYKDYLHSPQINFFTNWSLLTQQGFFYAALAARVAHSLVGSDLLYNAGTLCQVLGMSISCVLYFCASGLLVADDGTMAQVQLESSVRAMLKFMHHHFLQLIPWLLWYGTCPFVFASRMPASTLRCIWVAAGFVPFLLWTAMSSGVPDDYPSPFEYTTLCALLLNGIAPWILASNLPATVAAQASAR